MCAGSGCWRPPAWGLDESTRGSTGLVCDPWWARVNFEFQTPTVPQTSTGIQPPMLDNCATSDGRSEKYATGPPAAVNVAAHVNTAKSKPAERRDNDLTTTRLAHRCTDGHHRTK